MNGFQTIHSKYSYPKNLEQAKVYAQSVKLLPNFKSDLLRNTGFGLTRGALEMGSRLAVFRYFTEGLPSKPLLFNVEFYRKPLPIFVSAFATAWIRAPFEVIQKAFLADRKFPLEMQNGYKSYSSTFLALLKKDPVIFFRNTMPCFLGCAMETFFSFVIFDFIRDLSQPLHRLIELQPGMFTGL